MKKICGTCKHYEKTQLVGYDLKPYIGKGYTLDEILELSEQSEPYPIYDCPLADDWMEPNDECIINKWEPKDE